MVLDIFLQFKIQAFGRRNHILPYFFTVEGRVVLKCITVHYSLLKLLLEIYIQKSRKIKIKSLFFSVDLDQPSNNLVFPPYINGLINK